MNFLHKTAFISLTFGKLTLIAFPVNCVSIFKLFYVAPLANEAL